MTQPMISPGTVAQPLMLALFQPDIPQNTGTIVRMAACLGITVGIIEPAGFPVSDRAFRRAGMDYIDQAAVIRFDDWAQFLAWCRKDQRRLVLFSTMAQVSVTCFAFLPGDVLLFGRETSGVPDEVRQRVDASVRIPIRQQTRSLNLAVSAAMAAGEALRQLDAFPVE